jgi:hypothetical protein
MKTTNTNEYNNKVKAYLLERVDSSGYDQDPQTDREKFDFLLGCFKSEMGWNIERVGMQTALKEWLSGLPSSLTVDFTYCDIIATAKAWGSLEESSTEAQIDKICQNWFNFVAVKILQLDRKIK